MLFLFLFYCLLFVLIKKEKTIFPFKKRGGEGEAVGGEPKTPK